MGYKETIREVKEIKIGGYRITVEDKHLEDAQIAMEMLSVHIDRKIGKRYKSIFYKNFKEVVKRKKDGVDN